MKIKIVKLLSIFFLTFFIIGNKSICHAFENNIKGSTGWATVSLSVRASADETSTVVATATAGTPFLILGENGSYWKIEYSGKQGYINSDYCMINLPDIIPSIYYNISNANSSIYKSSGYNIPDVTGVQLYTSGKVWNAKIGRNEYICPILYSTAKIIYTAQVSALKDGYSLMIYDSYRPRSVSALIADKLSVLYNSNSTVKNNIDYSTGASGTQYSWGQSWFLAQGLSSHNTGAAIDVTLWNIASNKEVTMPTVMHELSTKAIKYYSSSASKVPDNYSVGMLNNTYAQKLDSYMTNAGMNTLASEWWHFQDQTGYTRIKEKTSSAGCNFQVTSIVSEPDIIKYTVTYIDGSNTYSESYEAGTTITLKTGLTKTGYTLKGWNYNNSCFELTEKITMPAQNITLTAIWKANTYKVSYNNYGESFDVTYDSSYGELSTPTKKGYTFKGWYLEGTFINQITADTIVKTANNHTLYAKWEPNSYKLTINPSGGEYFGEKNLMMDYNTTATINTPTKPGYTFKGWTLIGDDSSINGTTFTMGANDSYLIANWQVVKPDIEKTSNYVIKADMLTNINLNTTIEVFDLGINSVYKTKVIDTKKNEEKTSGLIATGDKIQIYLDNVLVVEYKAVVKGDVNGDGRATVADVSKAYQYVKKKITMDECYFEAGNTVTSDTEIKASDVAKLYQYIKNKISSLD